MAPERREKDTVAIPRSALQFAAGLATALLVGLGTVLWSVTTQSIRFDERVSYLEDFAKQGGRFTNEDGERLRKDIRELERWRQEHTEFGYDIVGRWNTLHNEHQRRLRQLENQNSANGNWE